MFDSRHPPLPATQNREPENRPVLGQVTLQAPFLLLIRYLRAGLTGIGSRFLRLVSTFTDGVRVVLLLKPGFNALVTLRVDFLPEFTMAKASVSELRLGPQFALTEACLLLLTLRMGPCLLCWWLVASLAF